MLAHLSHHSNQTKSKLSPHRIHADLSSHLKIHSLTSDNSSKMTAMAGEPKNRYPRTRTPPHVARHSPLSLYVCVLQPHNGL